MRAALALAAAAALAAGAPAGARTLSAGAGHDYAKPSLAIAAAAPGDTVLIEPGEYYDCAIVTADGLTIAGRAPGAVMTDTACEGKAILVIRGNDTIVRDLALNRARVPDGNGAGIRLEGQGLVLTGVTFVNDQVGVLAGAVGPGRVRLSDCRFERVGTEGGGTEGGRPSAALFVAAVAGLAVERTVFEETRGTGIASAALSTIITGSRIEATRFAVSASGALALEDDVLELSPVADGRQAAVLATGEAPAVLRRNRLVNRTGRPATLLLDWTGASPILADNVVVAGDRLIGSDGLWRHRAGGAFRALKDGARDLLGAAKRALR